MSHWQPTTILRFEKGIPSSACTALVQTDAGKGYLKGLGAPEGPHTLACEWVATQLAAWFGLATFDIALVEVTDADEIPFFDNHGMQIGQAQVGPAFISRAESGEPWSGSPQQLNRLVNPQDVGRLVVFDTWTLNCDRYSWPAGNELGRPRANLNNVFLSEEAPDGQFILKAMDHTHCFTCGRELTTRVAALDRIQDGRTFGLFPEFRPFLDRRHVEQAAADLRRIDQAIVQSMTRAIPHDWRVSENVRDALVELIRRRAVFVADTIMERLWPQNEFLFVDDGEHDEAE